MAALRVFQQLLYSSNVFLKYSKYVTPVRRLLSILICIFYFLRDIASIRYLYWYTFILWTENAKRPTNSLCQR